MPPELTLTILGDAPQQIVAPEGRFSIGRSDDNDLIIGSAGVSRRHALITYYDEAAQITDCGSQNGTFVNGRQIYAAVELNDGDLVSLGSVCEIRVSLRRRSEAYDRGSSLHPTEASYLPADYGSASTADRAPFKLNPQKIAMISIAVIVVITILVVLVLTLNGGDHNGSPPPATPFPTATETPSSPCERLTFAQVETAAEQVMGRVSNDSTGYAFPSDQRHLNRVQEVIQNNCQSPTLGATLRQLREAREQLKVLSNNQIDPDLLEYATLAELDGRSGDPLATARRIAPQLIAVSVLLKDRDAETALLLLAAFRMGPPQRGRHEILDRMRRAGINPSERNVWDLYLRRGLTEPEYDFVIRFLAFGIIARDPKKFGID